jgi:hypothetical protein
MGEPSPGEDVARAAQVVVQMWHGPASKSCCRCWGGETSLGVDVAGARRVLVQMWPGRAKPWCRCGRRAPSVVAARLLLPLQSLLADHSGGRGVAPFPMVRRVRVRRQERPSDQRCAARTVETSSRAPVQMWQGVSPVSVQILRRRVWPYRRRGRAEPSRMLRRTLNRQCRSAVGSVGLLDGGPLRQGASAPTRSAGRVKRARARRAAAAATLAVAGNARLRRRALGPDERSLCTRRGVGRRRRRRRVLRPSRGSLRGRRLPRGGADRAGERRALVEAPPREARPRDELGPHAGGDGGLGEARRRRVGGGVPTALFPTQVQQGTADYCTGYCTGYCRVLHGVPQSTALGTARDVPTGSGRFAAAAWRTRRSSVGCGAEPQEYPRVPVEYP